VIVTHEQPGHFTLAEQPAAAGGTALAPVLIGVSAAYAFRASSSPRGNC
jgi:hypothetical protein